MAPPLLHDPHHHHLATPLTISQHQENKEESQEEPGAHAVCDLCTEDSGLLGDRSALLEPILWGWAGTLVCPCSCPTRTLNLLIQKRCLLELSL